MTTAPTERAEVSIRPVERGDLLEVGRIERQAFAQPWPHAAFERFLGEPGFLAAESSGAVLGYVVGDLTHTYGRRRGHIKDIAVRGDVRGQGIGSRLLTHALTVLDVRGADTVRLEVRPSNDGARRLYRVHGFEPSRLVHGYYSDGEDALVMVRGPTD